METAISSSVTAMVTSLETVVTTNLPEIFTVFAALVALGLILRLVGRLIGGRA